MIRVSSVTTALLKWLVRIGSGVGTVSRRPVGTAAIVGAVTLLSACGGHAAIDPTATSKYIDDVEFEQTGFRPVDIRCPSGIPATAGGRLNCHFTGPEGPYTAYLRIVKVQGRRVAFDLKTQPSSWPPPTLR